MATVPAPKRGEIWLVDFDPAVGAEIRKLRPALRGTAGIPEQRAGEAFGRRFLSD